MCARTHSLPGRALALLIALSIATLGFRVGRVLPPRSGILEYQTPNLVSVPGGAVNVAGGNLIVQREDLSLDTPLGRVAIGAVYNSGSGEWQWSHRIRYDGATFVDANGASHVALGLQDGAPLHGTAWVVVDADTIRTKGGLEYHFRPDASLEYVRWATLDYPRITYAAGEIAQCMGPGACSPLFWIDARASGQPASITDARSGRVALFEYDVLERLVTARSPLEVVNGWPGTRYEYAPISARLGAIVNSEGERVEYFYQALSRISEVVQIGAGNPTHRFEYGARKRNGIHRTIHTNPLGGRTRYHCDRKGRLHRVELVDSGEVSVIEWAGRRPVRHIDAAGAVTRFAYENDLLVSVIEPSGNAIVRSYEPAGVNLRDPRRAPLRRVQDSLGLVEERSYDASGRVIAIANGEEEVARFEYLGTVVSSVTRAGKAISFPSIGIHGRWLQAVSDGELLDKRAFTPVGDARVESVARNPGGYLTWRFDANRALAALDLAAVDDLGNVTSTSGVAIARRSDGRMSAISRPGGGDHEFEYDAVGRLIESREWVDGAWQTTVIGYDLAGNEISRERPNGMREEFERDLYGRIVAHRALRHGVVEGEALFRYADGHLVERFDSIRGGVERYAHDSAGRLVSTFFVYGETENREFDLRNRMTRETLSLPGAGAIADIGYRYDLADRLVAVDDLSAASTLIEKTFEAGLLRSIRFANGLTRAYEYDAKHRIASMETRNAAGVVVESTAIERSGELDPPRSEILNATQTSLATTQERYSLPAGLNINEPDELAGKRVFAWADDRGGEIRYAWDAVSNSIENSAGDSFTYNAEGNRLLGVFVARKNENISYTYDTAGFATSRAGVPIDWSALGRLVRYGDATIESDMSGRLVAYAIGDERREFRLFGGRVESALDAIGMLDLGAVALHLGTGSRIYRHQDFRGNVSFVSDDGGNIISQYRYSPYGVEQVIGSGEDPRRFEARVAFGPLVLMGARVYDPLVGRFLSPDPILQLANQYAYTLGNPVSFEDSNGAKWSSRSAVSLGVGIVVLAAGLVAAAAIVATGPVGVVTATHVGFAATTAATITAGAVQVAFALADITAESSTDGGGAPSPPPAAPSPSPTPPGAGGSGSPGTLRVGLGGVGDVGAVSCSPLAVATIPDGRPLLPLAILANLLLAALWWHRRSRRTPH
jgi:RHS repeat-associated protein